MRPKKLRFGGVGSGKEGAGGADGIGEIAASGTTDAGDAAGEPARSCADPAQIGSSSAVATISPNFMSWLNSKRCKSCQILYQSAMKSVWITALGVALLLPVAQAKSPHCIFRVHFEANPRDTEVFATAVKANVGGKEIVIEKAASITESEVVAFQAYRAPDGSFGALLHLDDHGRVVLDGLSVERRGSHLFLFINGHVLPEQLIDRRVADGEIYIPSGLTAADLKLMKRDWKVINPKKARH
jgi:hypothetical protein